MSPSPRFVALLLAAGRSSRMQAEVPKPFLELLDRTVLEWSAARLAAVAGHAGTVVTLDEVSLAERFSQLSHGVPGLLEAIAGGETRQESTVLAWAAASRHVSDIDLVLVHDAARPFFSVEAAARAIAGASEVGGAIVGHYARDTLKRTDEHGLIRATVDREGVFQAATPQVFRRAEFETMLAHARTSGLVGTDESQLAEAAGIDVRAIAAPSTNIKLTHPEDLQLVPCLAPLLRDTSPTKPGNDD
jgi:2-C-methyl-D-erythritol 4-phosphate cytidylyltransferase